MGKGKKNSNSQQPQPCVGGLTITHVKSKKGKKQPQNSANDATHNQGETNKNELGACSDAKEINRSDVPKSTPNQRGNRNWDSPQEGLSFNQSNRKNEKMTFARMTDNTFNSNKMNLEVSKTIRNQGNQNVDANYLKAFSNPLGKNQVENWGNNSSSFSENSRQDVKSDCNVASVWSRKNESKKFDDTSKNLSSCLPEGGQLQQHRENVSKRDSPNVLNKSNDDHWDLGLPNNDENNKAVDSEEKQPRENYAGANKRYPKNDVGFNRSSSYNSSQHKNDENRMYRKSDYDHHSEDSDYNEFMRSYLKKQIDYTKVHEQEGDLFAIPEQYALGHCVAEDMNMGSGIAVGFRQNFKNVAELLDQKQKTGGLAVLKVKDRYIYYMVTKKYSNGKPTLYSLWCSLKNLKNHMTENDVTKLAIPRIGCGLDRLDWLEVKPMLEYIFTDTAVEIIVCNFQQADDGNVPTKSVTTTKIFNVKYPLADIESGTAIIYLGSTDGEASEELKSLDKKFDILMSYKRETKTVGNIIRVEKNNYSFVIYGFIMKTKKSDEFCFKNFQKCVAELQKQNRKDKLEYVGFQAFTDDRDDLIMNKIVNILRNSLSHVNIYICWPEHLQHLMPRENYKE